MKAMKVETDLGIIELIDEVTYSFNSTDNSRTYPFAKNLACQDHASSIHGVLLNGAPLVVLGNRGGCSGVHAHSCIYVAGKLYVAVGDSVTCIKLEPFELQWSLKTDDATCFGIYYQEQRQAFISHGEIEISRISVDGKILWSSSGADIFSERVSLLSNFIHAVDFSGRSYRFDYTGGKNLS